MQRYCAACDDDDNAYDCYRYIGKETKALTRGRSDYFSNILANRVGADVLINRH